MLVFFQIVVITGANTGIGKETAKELYKRGATILILCRSKARAEEAMREIKESKGKGGPVGSLDFVSLDLASLKSVRSCAEEVKSRVDKIDILINNAGLFNMLLFICIIAQLKKAFFSIKRALQKGLWCQDGRRLQRDVRSQPSGSLPAD